MGILQKLNCFSCQLRWGGGPPQTSVDKVNWQFYKVTICPRDADSPGSITEPWYNILCKNSAGPCQCWVNLIALLEKADADGQ